MNFYKRIQLIIRQHFDFSKRQTNGFLALIFLMVILLFIPSIFQVVAPQVAANKYTDQRILDSMVAMMEATKTTKELNYSHYEKKDYNNKYRPKWDSSKNNSKYKFKKKEFKPYEPKKIIQFDINEADSSQLEKIYGIGFKTAIRILKYRQRLGGFIHTDQYAEVWGLDTAVVTELKKRTRIAPDFIPIKIKINEAPFEEFKDHPYIGYKFAKVILAFKDKHGKYYSAAQLKEIKILTDKDIEKMLPYLEF